QPVGAYHGVAAGETEQGTCGHALARAGLTHQGDAFPLVDREGHPADHGGGGAEGDGKAAHVEQTHRTAAACQARPSTVTVTTTITIISPGKTGILQAVPSSALPSAT